MIDHNERAAAAEAWAEGFEAGATWPQSTPAGQSVDPPENPYRAAAVGDPETETETKPEPDAVKHRHWYESRTPDGKMWCEARRLIDVLDETHPSEPLTFWRFTVRDESYALGPEQVDPSTGEPS